MMVVDDVLEASPRLGAAARAVPRRDHRGDRLGREDDDQGGAAPRAGTGKVHASAASFNNHWGVPLTLARMPADTRFGVFEIGMNHPGEITPLVKLVRPHIAIVTLIAAAHLGHFKDLNEIAHAKAEIFSGVVSGGLRCSTVTMRSSTCCTSWPRRPA
jgi:hypothetical protein